MARVINFATVNHATQTKLRKKIKQKKFFFFISKFYLVTAPVINLATVNHATQTKLSKNKIKIQI